MITSTHETTTLIRRPRRNRKSPAIRALVQETHLHPSQLVVQIQSIC
jgi:porphobilinogen synthase